MALAAAGRMGYRTIAVVVLAAWATTAHALDLERLRVKATLVAHGSKDPFRIKGRIEDADPMDVVKGPVTLRFGAVRARIPEGAFRRRKSTYVWRSYLYGVKKVTINVRKATIDIVGGNVELGDLPGPVTLAMAMPTGVMCGRVVWTAEARTTRGSRRALRKLATGPLDPCVPPPGTDQAPPHVLITSPTSLDGTTSALPAVTLGGVALDDVGVAGLTWSSDRGGGASLLPAAGDWTIADVPLAAGDNRITVGAVDAAGQASEDTIVVTYNTNGIVFDGVPVADPDAVYENANARAAVRQGIVPNPDLDPTSVRLERIADDGATTPVAELKDDGSQDGGDVIPGDGVYTGTTRIQRTTLGLERYRVSARTLSQPDLVAWSPVLTVPVIGHVSAKELDGAIKLAGDARGLLANLAAGGVDPDEAVAQAVALAYASGAQVAGASDGGLGAWWVDENGLLGGALAYDTDTRRGGRARRTGTAAPAFRSITGPGDASALLQVGTRRSLILAPSFPEAEPAAVDAMLRGSQCPQFEVASYFGADAGAERFQNLEEYGIILVASHGDALFQNLGDAYRPEWSWSSQGAQTVVLTGTALGPSTLPLWERDLRLGRMAVFAGGTAAILPTFVTRYSIRLPASLVYVGSCRSAANPTMASALFERGAATYLGYDGYVASTFARDTGTALFADLLQGQTAGEAFSPVSDGGDPPASFVLAGRSDASLTADPVVNGSFEVTSGFEASVTGFTVTGDGRIVGNLGVTLPTDGQRMALVSTGLGLTKDVGTFAQPVCMPTLPPGKTKLMLYYDWNFFSEEFVEFCGSQYQDSFEVSFGATSLQSTKVDDVCGIVTPADVAFDQGGVYKTGWITQAVDVTALAGTTDLLQFGARDVGDSIYDSVILVDKVRIVAE